MTQIITRPRITFGRYFQTEKALSTISAGADIQPFAVLDNLKNGSVAKRPYATFEPMYWRLNGQFKFLPPTPGQAHVGYMSLSQSGVDSLFSVPKPTLTLTFVGESSISIETIVLRFSEASEDYCPSITVAYYLSNGSLIKSAEYTPDSWEFSTADPVDSIHRVIITFNSTSKPYRYARLDSIDFGSAVIIDYTQIVGLSVTEQVDPTGLRLVANTCEISLHVTDINVFDLVGDQALLNKQNPLSVIETIGGDDVLIGEFYLQDWTNESETELALPGIDLIGVLGADEYAGGLWTADSPIRLEDLLQDILGSINVPWQLDDSLYGVELHGWLPKCSYREALQQVGLAAGAYITCSRSRMVMVTPTPVATPGDTYAEHLDETKVDVNAKLKNKPLVTRVNVTAHDIVAGSGTVTLFDGDCGAGQLRVGFSQPAHTLVPTGATIVESGANYAVLNVAAPGAVKLEGQVYIDTRSVYTAEATPDTNVGRSATIPVEQATLVNSSNAAAVAARLLTYFGQRYCLPITVYGSTLQPMDEVLVDTMYGESVVGFVEKMVSDLAGGMVVDAEVTGVQV